MARVDIAALVLAAVGLLAAIADAETGVRDGGTSAASTGLRAVQSVTTAGLLVALVWRTFIALRLGRETGDYPLRASLITSGLGRQLALELLVCAVHVPPGVTLGTASIPSLGLTHGHTVTALATVPMVLRLYLMGRVYLNHAPYTSQRCVGRSPGLRVHLTRRFRPPAPAVLAAWASQR